MWVLALARDRAGAWVEPFLSLTRDVYVIIERKLCLWNGSGNKKGACVNEIQLLHHTKFIKTIVCFMILRISHEELFILYFGLLDQYRKKDDVE